MLSLQKKRDYLTLGFFIFFLILFLLIVYSFTFRRKERIVVKSYVKGYHLKLNKLRKYQPFLIFDKSQKVEFILTNNSYLDWTENIWIGEEIAASFKIENGKDGIKGFLYLPPKSIEDRIYSSKIASFFFLKTLEVAKGDENVDIDKIEEKVIGIIQYAEKENLEYPIEVVKK